jgi:hypothetical protein
MFRIEQDVRVLFGKLAQETYWLHKNDAKNVCMWVQQNTNSMFYYQKIGVDMGGGLTRQNMPFTLGIQTPWQKEMMIENGHQRGVTIDAAFGANEKKVIHSTCTCDLIH